MTTRKRPQPLPNLTPAPSPVNKAIETATAIQNEIGRYKVENYKDMSLNKFIIYETIGKGQYGEVKRVMYKPTNEIMAMKMISLSGDATKNQLLGELEVLRNSQSPFIVSFYGAFFEEGTVYYCMEFMDYGSLDKLYKKGVPEIVLAKIAYAMIDGLKYMKEKMNKMHRDVKPTNVLANKNGDIKLCDFGIVAELQQSIASTYIGCSMYMAPERINTTETSQGYGVYSDVWSVGLSLVEIGHGTFPYPSQKNVFDQLNAIVNGDPPKLDSSKFSTQAQDFIAQCLQKDFKKRPTYAELLNHEWIKRYKDEQFDMAKWMREAVK